MEVAPTYDVQVMLSHGALTPLSSLQWCAHTSSHVECAGVMLVPVGCSHKLHFDCLISLFLTVRLWARSAHLSLEQDKWALCTFLRIWGEGLKKWKIHLYHPLLTFRVILVSVDQSRAWTFSLYGFNKQSTTWYYVPVTCVPRIGLPILRPQTACIHP